MAAPDPAGTPTARAAVEAERFVELTLLVGIGAALVVVFLFSWLATEVLAGETRHFDTFLRNAVHAAASPGLTAVMLVATRFGSPDLLVPIGAATALLFYRLAWKRAAALLPITMLGAGVLDTVLKLSFRRVRPAAFFHYPAPTSFSFPSGHAMFSFCFFAMLAALMSPRVERRATRVAMWVTAALLVFSISLSRIYLGVHHPSDVIAGWGAGFVWVIIVAFGDRVAGRILRARGARGRASSG